MLSLPYKRTLLVVKGRKTPLMVHAIDAQRKGDLVAVSCTVHVVLDVELVLLSLDNAIVGWQCVSSVYHALQRDVVQSCLNCAIR